MPGRWMPVFPQGKVEPDLTHLTLKDSTAIFMSQVQTLRFPKQEQATPGFAGRVSGNNVP